MSLDAGAVCLFNCDQNGRDLPPDNELTYTEKGPKYTVGIPHHYFLVLSARSFNDKLHMDFSKMESCADKNKVCNIKLCVAVPIDIIKDDLNPYIYTLTEEDYMENIYNPKESSETVKRFKEKINSVICNKICKLNIKSCKSSRILFYISPMAFENVVKGINQFFNTGKSELTSILKK